MAGAASGRQPGSAHHALGGSGRPLLASPLLCKEAAAGGIWLASSAPSPPPPVAPRLHRYYVRLPKDRGIQEPPAEAGGKPSARTQRYSLCVLVAAQLWRLKGQLCVEFNAALSYSQQCTTPFLVSSQRSCVVGLSWPKEHLIQREAPSQLWYPGCYCHNRLGAILGWAKLILLEATSWLVLSCFVATTFGRAF